MLIPSFFSRASFVTHATIPWGLPNQPRPLRELRLREPLAIIGMGCRFPGNSDTPEALWQFLCDGGDGICEVPADRWDVRKYYDPDPTTPGRMHIRQGGFLRGSPWEFDAAFFGISPREAAVMDPQQRLLLETTWEAFEHAGLPLDDDQRRRTGVYVGAFCFDNAIQQMGLLNRNALFSNSATSSSLAMLSNRISYVFDLGGPCLTVDTACSSSLVATHLGCRALWARECDFAVIGGVNFMLRPESTILEAKGGFLSSDARCKAFGAGANGYVRSEGAGVVVVRRLSAALDAGDRIVALIRGTGVNQDGRTPSITVPSGRAQEELIRQVCAESGIDPGEIGYVEAHGTGTPVGDPIEAAALGRVLGHGRGSELPWVGSVKTNIGHLEAGAGVAGLMKAALCLAHQQIPPHLHAAEPNAQIDLAALRLRLPAQIERLSPEQGRYAAINSFGYGGTNAHVILERAPRSLARPIEPGIGPWLIPLSARADDTLRRYALALAGQIERRPGTSITAFGHALGVRRAHHDHRAVVVARDRGHLVEQLRLLAEGVQDPSLRTGHAGQRRRLVLVYTGMGPQWWGMGRGLYSDSDVFRRAIVACDEAWRRSGGGDELRRIFDPGESLDHEYGASMPEPCHAQPANLALQVGVTSVLRSLGVGVDAVVGHSVGEIGAAWAAEVLTLDEAFRLTFVRSRLQQEVLGDGTMLALAAPAEVANKWIRELGLQVEIAAFNDGESVTLGGTMGQLQRIEDRAATRGIRARKLQVGVAYHTHQMDPLRERFVDRLAGLPAAAPRVPLYSTVTGARARDGEQTLEYWWHNARAPVRLADSLAELRRDGFDAFLEVGPHPVLGPSIQRVVPGAVSWASQRRDADDTASLLRSVGDCHCAGVAVNWRAIHPVGEPDLRAPRYPFQRKMLWRETTASRADRLVEDLHPLLHQRLSTPRPSWQTLLNEQFLPWLNDHRVSGAVVFPAAGYASAALAAADQCKRGNAVVELTLRRALEPRPQTVLQIEMDPRDGHLTMHSLAPREDADWQAHVTARLPEGRLSAGPVIDLAAVRGRCPVTVEVDALYRSLAARGLQYGPWFRAIRGLRVGPGEALVNVHCDDPEIARYALHPVQLDAAFQAMLAALPEQADGPIHVPTYIRALRFHDRVGSSALIHVRVERRGASSIVGELRIIDTDGRPLVEIDGVRCERVAAGRAKDGAGERTYSWCWEEAPALALPAARAERWLVLAGEGVLARRLLRAAGVVGGLSLAVVRADELAGRLTGGAWAGIVDLRGFDHDDERDPIGEGSCAALLELARTLVAAGDAAPPRLVVVTRGAAPIGGGPVRPASGSLWGLGRVVRTECAELGVTLIDLGEHEVDPRGLLAELLADGGEDEVALRGAERHVPRLDRCRPGAAEPTPSDLETPLRLELGTPGALGSLCWVPDRRRRPGPGQVEIRVHSASLNFKDLMKALNLLPVDYLDTTFIGGAIGMECAGTVVAVGEDVLGHAPGDEVIVIAGGGCFRSYHTVDVAYVVRKPASLSFTAAPSLIAYLTAHYALRHLADVQPLETVLIHAAAGGVGQAAIQVARRLGATILATAGSAAKRAFLREQGVEHVFDSRSLEFVEAIRAITSGRGVDVVLNSLSGEAARQSLAIVAPHGRFIEIGKTDITAGHSLGLSDFDRNLTYVSVDTDRMANERPGLVRELLDEVVAQLAAGELVPVSTQEFPAHAIQEAFRTMARALHIGKIVVDLKSGEVPVARRRGIVIRPDRTWLITGGLGGFGLQVGEWLVDQGARRLVLLGRSGASRAEARSAIARMRGRGAVVEVVALDVADRTAVRALVSRIAGGPSPLQGIMHAAMVLDDGALATLDPARLAAVMRPKALGAWNLHEATRELPLEAFVMFSSVSTFVGNAGQGSYVAANGFLEALAWHRRARRLPALAINWGAIADVGVVARDSRTAAYLASIGIVGLNAGDYTDALGALLASDSAQVGMAEIDWMRWAESLGHVARAPRFCRLVAAGDPDGSAELPVVAELRLLPEDERLGRLKLRVRAQLARVMQQDCARVDVNLGLDRMGVDSLMALELLRGLRAELGVELTTMTLTMPGVTVGCLAQQLLGCLFSAGGGAPSSAAPAFPRFGVARRASSEARRVSEAAS